MITALKARARSKNRSLEGELREILRKAAFGESVAPRQGPTENPLAGLKTVEIGGTATFSRDEIYGDDEQ